ncbi:MAG: LuxR C-terminal-related transcriptional regulator [Saonia sp.]
MIKKLVLLLIAVNCMCLYAQDAISGYVNRGDAEEWEREIHLSEIKLRDIPDFRETKWVAKSTIGKDGYFSFDRKQIADKNTIYSLHVNLIQKILNDTLTNHTLFILSDMDSIHFKKGKKLFAGYNSTNTADAEWRRLRKFETKEYDIHWSADSISNAYVGGVKNYVKDSLQILMVKLISIRQLESKKLLDKDIVKNPDYYVELLKELKASDLERSEYLFLENKLAFLTHNQVAQKYRTSKGINIALGVVILGLLLFIGLRKNRNTKEVANLSKQEQNVQNLIIAGKSNKEIANELFISISTVKTHITNIYSKLKVSNRQELLQKTQN